MPVPPQRPLQLSSKVGCNRTSLVPGLPRLSLPPWVAEVAFGSGQSIESMQLPHRSSTYQPCRNIRWPLCLIHSKALAQKIFRGCKHCCNYRFRRQRSRNNVNGQTCENILRKPNQAGCSCNSFPGLHAQCARKKMYLWNINCSGIHSEYCTGGYKTFCVAEFPSVTHTRFSVYVHIFLLQ